MKVDFNIDNNRQNTRNNVNFEGYRKTKDQYGNVIYEFNYPYDSTKYDCYLEVCKVGKDEYNNYFIVEGVKSARCPNGYLKLNPEKNKVDLSMTFGLMDKQPFAYHYALVPKGADRNDPNITPQYKIDAGDYIDFRKIKNADHEIYNIAMTNGSASYSAGAMKLLMPDFYNPAWVYDENGSILPNPRIKEIRNITKTFANKIGGSLAGIEKDVKDGKFNGYAKIISTPLFTDDSVSAHAYWNKNCMQMAQSLGNINNYASLQREMFKKGINFVSDGAFVNEGIEGVHFKNVLKWGEKSPYFFWFEASNLKDNAFSLGVFGKNNEYISHKIVNSKYTYTQDPKTGKITIGVNKKYEKDKPTYFQIYDKRLVLEKHIKDPQYLIKDYDMQNTDNPLDINTHNDTVVPYAFEVDSEDYNENIKKLIEYNNNVAKSPPMDFYQAASKAVQEVFPSKVDMARNMEVQDILYKAIEDVEDSDSDKKYSQKVDLVLKRAKTHYGLKMPETQENALSYNLKKLHGLIKMDSYMGTRFLSKFENFELEEKIESKVTTWNANTDIPKLKYLYTKKDTQYLKMHVQKRDQADETKKIIYSNYGVQDYAIQSGIYWTEKTKDILNLYVAQNLLGIDEKNPKKAYEQILQNIRNGKFPQKLKNEINIQIVKNVLNDDYELQPKSKAEYKNYLLQGLMKLPLDSVEFGDNLVSVLASPYISKRAIDKDTLGTSRYDMYVNGNPHLLPEYASTYKRMDKIYEKELSDFAQEIIDNLNPLLPPDVQLYSGYRISPYGQYVIPLISETIAKYAIVKSLAPNVEVKINKNTGEISYDYDALKNTTLQSIGVISPSGPKDEAEQVLSKLRAGLKKINTNDKRQLVEALHTSLKGTNEISFMLAEMITDRLNAGLDWRIDAAKDIGDINALNSGKEQLDETWSSVTDFWKAFCDGVFSKNRNAYIVAEITDEGTMFSASGGKSNSRKYSSPNEMITKFLRETGMTSVANYSQYFSSILNLFGKHFDTNDQNGSDGFAQQLSRRMHDKSAQLFNYMPYDGIINSYNFIGNHDKPRALHGLILDTTWFRTDLPDAYKNSEYRIRAQKILTGKYNNEAFLERKPDETEQEFKNREALFIKTLKLDSRSGKALAMAEALHAGFAKALQNKYEKDPAEKARLGKIFDEAIADLANGSYKGENFEADGFGVKPVDTAIALVLNQAVYRRAITLSNNEFKEMRNDVLKEVLSPALSKLKAMTEVLTVMPGMPTLYAGDDIGATGYESEQKNLYLQNRSYIHNEWLDEKYTDLKFIQEHYDDMNKLITMRNRPELHALNDGAPFLLDPQKGRCQGRDIDVSTILRQGSDNSIVISMINTSGINHIFDHKYNPEKVTLESITIKNTNNNNPRELSNGLTPGTIFYNADNPEDQYIVREYQNNIFIKRRIKNDYNDDYHDGPIELSGTTLTLYSKPKPRKPVKTIYNKKFLIGPRAYTPVNVDEIGGRLSLVSN